MTNEEAIEILENKTCYECGYGCHSILDCVTECELKNAMKEAIESLEKQIPKKPKTVTGYLDYDAKTGVVEVLHIKVCPKCHAQLFMLNKPVMYCDCCGQAISVQDDLFADREIREDNRPIFGTRLG